jgi:roadblock/LC7 domain-containing protein
MREGNACSDGDLVEGKKQMRKVMARTDADFAKRKEERTDAESGR